MKYTKFAGALPALLLFSSVACDAAPMVRVGVIPVGALTDCKSLDINDAGQVLLQCGYAGSGFHVYTPGKGLRATGNAPGYEFVSLVTIDKQGRLGGTVCVGNLSVCVPAVWDESTGFNLLASPEEYHRSWAYAMNDRGQVVGKSYVGPVETDTGYAFAGSLKKGYTVLKNGGSPISSATAVNNHGMVVAMLGGSQFSSRPAVHVAVDRRGHMTRLGGIGKDINDRGQIAGWYQMQSFHLHAYVWSAETGTVDIDGDERYQSLAYAINDAGNVVGTRGLLYDRERSFYWEPASGFHDLLGLIDPSDPLKDRITFGPARLNNKGQIVGGGSVDEVRAALVLTPVE